eukprot:1611560-Amphidinium_carterae.1
MGYPLQQAKGDANESKGSGCEGRFGWYSRCEQQWRRGIMCHEPLDPGRSNTESEASKDQEQADRRQKSLLEANADKAGPHWT